MCASSRSLPRTTVHRVSYADPGARLVFSCGWHRIAPIQRVLHHVDSELPRGPDDADLHHVRQAYSWVTPSAVSNDAPAFTLSRLSTELLSRHVNWRSTSTRAPSASPRST